MTQLNSKQFEKKHNNILMKIIKIFLASCMVLVSFILKAQVYEEPVTGNIGIGTTTIDNIQSWNKVLQLNGQQHSKLLVTENGGVKVGMYAYKGYSAKIGTESNHNLTFTSGYWNDVMTLTTSGNVGIGTLVPREKLSVNGKIRAQEIKVEATNWPDYVFSKGYQLPSLKETEQHIRDKGHLEGIPSAEEVKTNGVDLGEMNAKLLKKIEELTLYLIEIKKDHDLEKRDNLEQKKIIHQQQKDIKYLKSKLK